MIKEIRLPKLGQTMGEAAVVGFCAGIGDAVKAGAVLYEVETDKAAMEVESPCDGFVKYIFARSGQTLAVGEPVMLIGDKDEQVPQSLIDLLKSQIANHKEADEQTQEHVNGQILPGRESIAPEEITLGAAIPITRLQKITAERMLRSKLEKPAFYLNVRADVTDMVELRGRMNEKAQVKVAYNDFIIKAVAAACEKFPIMAGRIEGSNLHLPEKFNVGLAVSITQGLVVPVVKDAGNKNIATISRETKSLIQKARDNKLQLSDLEGACITVSNLGDFGADSFIPIVIPGQAAILGIGRITDTCVPNFGEVVIRKLMSLTISVDHRIANGAYAAQFLDYVKKYLEDKESFIQQ
ncbi:MAG: 2-oxo acid dehydrogenase subunit E2 [Candidatus Brocadiia bacterium]|nr:MAG: 2-oxo acid dehydrogenase subunit E2 [Candidatus Brocadiia bacterium]